MNKFFLILKQYSTQPAWRDLALLAGLASLALVIVLLDLQRSVAMLFTIPLVLLYPGYALIAALFPYSGLDRPSRALLCVSLSVTLTILTGFIVNRLPLGLYAGSWAISLWFVTIAACIVAFLRRLFAPASQQALNQSLAEQCQNIRIPIQQLALVGGAILLCIAGLVLAQYEAQRQPPANTVQLWLLPMPQAGKATLRLGLDSIGSASGRFKVMLMRDGVALKQWELNISPGERWETVVELQPGIIPQAIDAQLYRTDEPGKLYRNVRFWLQP